jgi:multicomponent K+:H+ antiporter subunit G
MIDIAMQIALVLMAIALLLNLWRLLRGPSAADRVVALDTMYVNTVALLVLLGVWRGTRSTSRPVSSSPCWASSAPSRCASSCCAAASSSEARMTEIIVSFFLLVGAGFALIGSIGLVRLPDFFSRLHGPTKATTLGVGGMLIASASGDGIFFTVFLFMASGDSACTSGACSSPCSCS